MFSVGGGLWLKARLKNLQLPNISLLLIGRLRIGVNCDKIVYKMKVAPFYLNMGYLVSS